MPFYLSLATFLMSFSFFMYGFLEHDAFICVSFFDRLSSSNLLPFIVSFCFHLCAFPFMILGPKWDWHLVGNIAAGYLPIL